ncbi:hypothetical protein HIM_08225 [Hirsutella minnesotensis 3608]|uniref:RNA polymerase II-associated protein RBA50 n=1 Tax=Hirsutella minnesotensis 3608 TaxID=1043627 RepID=A0A0F7ZYG3_9HYPO|nr:hypothetical protein HIM_08225 [Hirsutella minnesotensis 3608]
MDSTLLIGDIVERDSSASKPVEFPAPPSSSTGFPQHKRRWKPSVSRQQKSAVATSVATQSDKQDGRQSEITKTPIRGFEEAEKQRIDQENRQKIASMTPQEIAQAQQDIMTGLNPALIQRLLQRANIDDDTGPSPFDTPPSEEKAAPFPPSAVTVEDASTSPEPRRTREPSPPEDLPSSEDSKTRVAYDEDKAPPQIPADLFPITDLPKSTHFPPPPVLPDLDPAGPDFLATLHEKYFPNLPADPSKLAWMAPVPSKDSPADKDSPYYPHPEISIAALRFDFRGRFLSPRVSRSIPSTRGLHHHGEAPEAAGYTVAELAHLARSSVPAQRCMAYQTLGRILYRLGQGEWGKTENDPIAIGIWSSMKQGRVLESLLEAAAGEGGHRGSRAYATEALWLFEKGGWREKFKGR